VETKFHKSIEIILVLGLLVYLVSSRATECFSANLK